ncbi:MAG: methyltransferase domain-containing protein [Rhodocyclales bacterium]|nr:methyltransferase domain-containing protein [Rhodocyclales bacterium]
MAEASAKPDHQRPELPDFWDKRFQSGVMPWDAGAVPTDLQAYLRQQGPGQARRVLVPGCGSAHEAAFLDQLGWSVVALDFSAAAVETARRNLGDWGGTLVQEDFFAHSPASPYALVYERAFLCALPRKLWAGYGERMMRLLAPGGHLAGYYFFGDDLKGPPFAIDRPQLDALLTPYFDLVADDAVADSIPAFAGRERWLVWRRR